MLGEYYEKPDTLTYGATDLWIKDHPSYEANVVVEDTQKIVITAAKKYHDLNMQHYLTTRSIKRTYTTLSQYLEFKLRNTYLFYEVLYVILLVILLLIFEHLVGGKFMLFSPTIIALSSVFVMHYFDLSSVQNQLNKSTQKRWGLLLNYNKEYVQRSVRHLTRSKKYGTILFNSICISLIFLVFTLTKRFTLRNGAIADSHL